jgi:phosphatidate cytidylyltransferase
VTDEKTKANSNLAMRFLTALVFIPLILWLLFWVAPVGFVVLVYLACAVAAAELFAMTLPGARVLQIYGVLATLGILTSIVYLQNFGGVLAPIIVLLTVVGLLLGLATPEPIDRASERIAWLIAGPLYIGGLVATVALLHIREHQGAWVLLSMLLAWMGDTGGYFAGRFFGKHKLYERVSPKKTIEGSIGGLAGSVLGALIAHFWFLPELPLIGGILLALVGGGLGQAGDLCESLIKRGTGVKDSGSILPGHGGILDRIDALMFTAASTWVYATYILDRQ